MHFKELHIFGAHVENLPEDKLKLLLSNSKK